MLSDSQNWLATVKRTAPQWMPYQLALTRASWHRFGSDQEEVLLRHPRTWPDYREGDYQRILEQPWSPKEDPTRDFVDEWGCVWRTTQHGFVGTIVDHPLADADALESFDAPPRETYNGGQNAVDFTSVQGRFAQAADPEVNCRGSLDHGFFLLRLEYLRGFENFMCDLVEPSDEFRRLYDTVHELNKAAVQNWISVGARIINLPEDLGGQDRSLIGPAFFRQWGLPAYCELHGMAHEAGCLTQFHCDGYIMDIADQILEIGPDVFNPQDRANGIDDLAKVFKGKLCLALDFDRQHALPFGTRQEIEELIEYEVRTLGSSQGGLTIHAEIRGDVPPDNLDATVSAMERYSTFWFN